MDWNLTRYRSMENTPNYKQFNGPYAFKGRRTIYHGTPLKYLDSILKDGIRPRSETGISTDTRYKTDFGWMTSPEGMVYAHAILAPQYGLSFSFAEKQLGFALLEIEVDSLDANRIVPDEDFLAARWALEFGGSLSSWQETAKKNLKAFGSLATECFSFLGQIAHIGTILPSQVVRVGIVEPSSAQAKTLASLMRADTSTRENRIGLRSFESQIMSGVTRWCMGDRVQIENFEPEGHRITGPSRHEISRMLRDTSRRIVLKPSQGGWV